MNFSKTALRRALFATAASAALGGPAFAQTTPSDGTVGEVVVTAQKREERVQDVPVAVQVLSGAALEAQGVRQFEDLTRAAPSLVIRPSEHPVNASVSIRGIGTFAFAAGVEPSVAVQMDDVPVAFQARAFSDLSDVERIEVLRGPQSTLYGRSASAGLINIVTRGATPTLTGRIGGMVTSDDEVGVNFAVSGPLGETLGFRVSGNYSNYEGNVRNIFLGKKVNGRETYALRGKLVWDPSDRVNVTAQADYLHGITTIGRPFIALGPNARLRGVAAYNASVFAPGVTVDRDNRDVVNNVVSGTKYNDFFQSLRVSVDLGGPTFVSISAHDEFKQFDNLDQDESAVAALDNRQFGTFDSSQVSQEFRLVSPGEDRFRYTLGAFYSRFEYDRPFFRGPVFANADWDGGSVNKQYAAFGQLDYDILDTTTLIGGLRVGKEKISVNFVDFRAANATFVGDSSHDYVTWKAGVQHKFTPDVMAFLTYATGHKGQAYDVGTGFNASRLDPVDEETSKDWQLGVKSQFLDRRVTLNATIFDTRFKGFQAQGIETLPDGTQNFRLANVGRLRTRGVEVEGSWLMTDDLLVSGGATYIDAEITEFPLAQCYPGQTAAQGCVGSPARQNLAGFRPAQAPEWKINLAGEFTPNLTATLDGVVQVSYSYQSKINFSLNQDPQTEQPGYSIVNLSAGVRDVDRRWEVVAFVNNLLDEQYFTNLTNSFGNFGNNLATQSYLPRDFRRYVGVRASVNF